MPRAGVELPVLGLGTCWLDERECALEALLCMKRAGADLILTNYATEAATWLNEEGLQPE